MPPRRVNDPGTQKIGRTTPQVNTDLAGSVQRTQVQSLKQQSQAVIAMTGDIQNLLRRSDRLKGEALRTVAQINDEALKANARNRAKDFIIEGALAIDAQLQELVRDPNIQPLEYAQRGEDIIKKVSNEFTGKASQLGAKEQAFVREKLNNQLLQKVPGLRREGFKRESDQQLAGLQKRLFDRKSEMWSPGMTLERRQELFEDNIADIMGMSGTYLSPDDVEKMIQAEGNEVRKNTILELAQEDPLEALEVIKEAKGLSPREEQTLTNQVRNVLAIRDAEEAKAIREQEAFVKRQQEEAYNIVTDGIIAGGNARALMANPQLEPLLNGKAKQSLLRFEKSQRQNAGKTRSDTTQLLQARLLVDKGQLGPTELTEKLTQLAEAEGSQYTNKDILDLQARGMKAWDLKQRREGTRFDSIATQAEAGLKRSLDFEKGAFAFLESDKRSQLNLVVSSTLNEYSQRITDIQEEAESAGPDGVDPLQVGNPVEISDELLLRALPGVIDALGSQTVDNSALRGILGRNPRGMNVAEIRKKLIKLNEIGDLTDREFKSASAMLKFTDLFQTLKGKNSVEQGEKSTELSVREATNRNKNELLKRMGREPRFSEDSTQDSSPINNPTANPLKLLR